MICGNFSGRYSCSAAVALFNRRASRDFLRAAVRLCRTPLRAATSMASCACRQASRAFSGSPDSTATTAFLMAVRVAPRTVRLRSRRFIDWRCLFLACLFVLKSCLQFEVGIITERPAVVNPKVLYSPPLVGTRRPLSRRLKNTYIYNSIYGTAIAAYPGRPLCSNPKISTWPTVTSAAK